MNILYVVPYVPNQIRVRPYQLIRGLAGLGHQVTVLTLQSSKFEQDSLAALQSKGIQAAAYPLPAWRSLLNCLAGLPSKDPLQSYYCWSPPMASRLVELAGASAADIVHVEHMRGARFGQHLLASTRRLPVVWDSVDCITHLFRQSAQQSKGMASRWITRFELARSGGYEGRLAALFDRVLVTSPADRQALLNLTPAESEPRVDVLPNGVDLEYFQAGPEEERSPETVVVSGKMSYHANVAMVLFLAEEIMPRVWAEKPGARLLVVGKDPPRPVRALAGNPRVTVTGYVPDIRPYMRKAAVAAAPLTYGAGIQNKILEAMACATPVVTTSLAVSALAAVPGQDLLAEDTPAGFAARIIQLLNHPVQAREIGRAGRCYVEAHHNWSRIAARLTDIYQEEIARKKPGERPGQKIESSTGSFSPYT